jgi:hypothetical protein
LVGWPFPLPWLLVVVVVVAADAPPPLIYPLPTVSPSCSVLYALCACVYAHTHFPTPHSAPRSTPHATAAKQHKEKRALEAGAGGGPRVPIGPGPAALCTTEADDGNYTVPISRGVGAIAKKAGALARDQTQGQVANKRPPCSMRCTALAPLTDPPPPPLPQLPIKPADEPPPQWEWNPHMS